MKTLFWVPVGVKDRTVWALIDTSLSHNLISQRDYEALPQPPTLRPPGTLMVVAGNNQEISWVGGITIRFPLNTGNAYQEVDVVRNLPIDMLIGGEFLRPHECQIVSRRRVAMLLESRMVVSMCLRNKEKRKMEHDPQLQATPKRTPAKRMNLSCVVVPHGYLMSRREGARKCASASGVKNRFNFR